jgi:hypothetical protein
VEKCVKTTNAERFKQHEHDNWCSRQVAQKSFRNADPRKRQIRVNSSLRHCVNFTFARLDVTQRWLVAMDVSGQPTNRLSRNVCNYLRNIPEEWTSHRHHAVSWRISLHFGQTCCLHAEDRIMIRLPWIWRNQVPLRRWHLSATTRGVATHGTVNHSHRCPRIKNPCEA